MNKHLKLHEKRIKTKHDVKRMKNEQKTRKKTEHKIFVMKKG